MVLVLQLPSGYDMIGSYWIPLRSHAQSLRSSLTAAFFAIFDAMVFFGREIPIRFFKKRDMVI